MKLLLAAACLWLAGPAVAELAVPEGAQAAPPSQGGPVEVTLLFGLLDIVDIDDKAQRFEIDAYTELSWQDPRLAARAGEEALRVISLEDIWNPGLVILNDRGIDRLLPEVATVDAQGWVTVRHRLAGPLVVDLDLHEFPFDQQILSIDIVSYLHGLAELEYSSASELVARVDEFSAEGWIFEPLPVRHSTFRLRESGEGTPLISFQLRAQRDALFHVITLVFPMILILLLAWVVHWLPPQLSPPRIGTASATVFSVIAFGVSLRLGLPQVGYLTVADRFVLGCIILVGVSLAVAVMTARRVDAGDIDRARLLAKIMCWVFPLAVLLIVQFSR